MANADYQNDPVLRIVADTLDLLGVPFTGLSHSLENGHQTVKFISPIRPNRFGRYDEGDFSQVVRLVRDHYQDHKVAVEYQVNRLAGTVSFRLIA